MKTKILSLFLLCYSTIIFSQSPCPETPAVNYGGKIYTTVKIGTQCWLKENLEIGIMIPGNQNQSDNKSVEKYFYNNDSLNNKIYGSFYQWNEAMQYKIDPGSRGICPLGWHIPTQSEFQILADYVQNNGNALKAIGSGTGNGSGTNSSGFSSLICGYRGNDGYFVYQNGSVRYWTSTQVTPNDANTILLYNNLSNIGMGSGDKEFGYCVRCIKDNNTNEIQKEGLPYKFDLFQNYPNPFNPITIIKFSLPQSKFVTIRVYDLMGRQVFTPVNDKRGPGMHEIEFNGSFLVSGIYFYKIQAGEFSQTRKMILLK